MFGDAGVARGVICETMVDHDNATHVTVLRSPALRAELDAMRSIERELVAIDVGGDGRPRRVPQPDAARGRSAAGPEHDDEQ